jgi:AcrR family transcriptional regulator
LVKQQEADRRQCIVTAAFSVLKERGYVGTSTLEIARRARVSKRELYAEFGSKSGILEAVVAATAARMRLPLTGAEIADRGSLAAALVAYGTTSLTELTSPPVVAINRLAAAEAGSNSDLGDILERKGREPNRKALIELMAKAQSARLLGDGSPELIAGQYFSLLFGDVLLRLMLGVAKRPTAIEIRRRAEVATDTVLRLYDR